MKMSRIDRRIRTWDVTNTLANGVPTSIPGVDIALLPPLAQSPTAATVWTPMAYDSTTGKATILLAGPEADSTGALVVTATAAVWMRVTDAPEVEAISVERITVAGSGSLPPLPVPYVASVVGATGAVSGTQIAADPALRAALVPFWTAGEVVTAGTVRMASDGHVIDRIANGTARPSYDATEQALWTVIGGGSTGALLAASNLSDVANASTARTNLGLGTAATQPTSAFDAAGAAALRAPLLTPTATKTTAYTAVVGDLAMMNVPGGATVLTLPTAPANKSQVGFRAIGATAAVPLVINRGGSTDTIGTAGATTATIPLADETLIYQYDAPNTRWLAVSNVKTKASLDTLYLSYDPSTSGLAATTVQAAIDELLTDLNAGDAASVTAARNGVLLTTDITVLDRGNAVANAAETMLRTEISGNFNLTAGTVVFSYFTPRFNRTIGTAEVWTAATAASPAPTLARIGLYSVDGSGNVTLIGSTPSDTTLFIAASTQYARALSVATAITKGSRYAWGILQVGSTTAPKIYGAVTVGALMTRAPTMAASLASQTDLPSTVTVGSLGATTGMAYVAGY